MLRELDLLTQAISDLAGRIGFTEIAYAYLGRGDGLGTLVNPNGFERDVWVRRSDNQELFTAYLPSLSVVPYRDGDPNVERIEVRVGKPPLIDRYVVIDALSLAGIAAVGAVSPMEALIYEALWAALKNFRNLRARPNDPTNTDVIVDGPLVYTNPSTGLLSLYTTSTVGSAIQTAITALAAGQHQLAIIYLNKLTNTLGLATGTAVAATGTLPARSEFTFDDVSDITLSSDYTPSIVIYLYYGQTAVSEADHYRDWDLRPLFGGGSAAGFDHILTDANGNVVSDANGDVLYD